MKTLIATVCFILTISAIFGFLYFCACKIVEGQEQLYEKVKKESDEWFEGKRNW